MKILGHPLTQLHNEGPQVAKSELITRPRPCKSAGPTADHDVLGNVVYARVADRRSLRVWPHVDEVDSLPPLHVNRLTEPWWLQVTVNHPPSGTLGSSPRRRTTITYVIAA